MTRRPERARPPRDLLFPFVRTAAVSEALKPHRWMIPVIGGLSVLLAALEGVAVALIVPLLTLLLTEGASAGGGILGQGAMILPEARRLPSLVALILLFVVLKNLVGLASQVLLGRLDAGVGLSIRAALAHFVLRVGYPFFLTTPPHELVNVVSGESWRATDAIRAHASAVGAIAAVGGYLAILVALDWRLALGVAGAGALIRVVEARLTARTTRHSAEVTVANDALANRMLSVITNMRLVRIFGAEAHEAARFDRASSHVARAVERVWRSGALITPVTEILYMIVFAAILVLSVADGRLDLPRLAAFLVVLQRAQPHLRALEQSRVAFSAASGGMARVEAVLDPTGKPGSPVGILEMRDDGPVRRIEAEAVTYRYPNSTDRDALGPLSFAVGRGEVVAVTGPSGVGKSTLIALLARLIEPTQGRVLVDGQALDEIDPAAWRGRIALAGQDIELAQGTVAENVAYGAAEASDEAVWAALRAADAEGFVRALPHGLKTDVGDRGASLSGGQRQRIGLARAFLRRADVLILDEATSALDAASEARVMAALRADGKGITLVVSHRKTAIAACDRSIQLHQPVP